MKKQKSGLAKKSPPMTECHGKRAGLEDHCLDLVLCIEVLSDLSDLEPALQEMYRFPKADGVIVRV